MASRLSVPKDAQTFRQCKTLGGALGDTFKLSSVKLANEQFRASLKFETFEKSLHLEGDAHLLPQGTISSVGSIMTDSNDRQRKKAALVGEATNDPELRKLHNWFIAQIPLCDTIARWANITQIGSDVRL